MIINQKRSGCIQGRLLYNGKEGNSRIDYQTRTVVTYSVNIKYQVNGNSGHIWRV